MTNKKQTAWGYYSKESFIIDVCQVQNFKIYDCDTGNDANGKWTTESLGMIHDSRNLHILVSLIKLPNKILFLPDPP